MLFSVEQAFVGREEIRSSLKTPAWEATCAPEKAIVVLTGLQNMRNINRRGRQKLS